MPILLRAISYAQSTGTRVLDAARGTRLRISDAIGSAADNRAGSAALLLGVPIATFGVVTGIAALHGRAYEKGCDSYGFFVAHLLSRPTESGTACSSVPFLADVPTVILSFTSPFALVAFQLLRRRLHRLLGDLLASGLLRKDLLSAGFLQAAARVPHLVDTSRRRSVALFVISLALVTWLYWRNAVDGQLFRTLSAGAAEATAYESLLRGGWWAHYRNSFVLAAVCVLIGTVGVHYSLRAAWLYLKLGRLLISVRADSVERLSLQYVPTWRDRSYGWAPVTGVMLLLYLSTANFALSMVSVFDMLSGRVWTLLVAGLFSLLGVVSNLVVLGSSLTRVMTAHRVVKSSVLHSLESADLGRPPSIAQASAIGDLAEWRRIPVASVGASALKVLPGVLALVRFLESLWTPVP